RGMSRRFTGWLHRYSKKGVPTLSTLLSHLSQETERSCQKCHQKWPEGLAEARPSGSSRWNRGLDSRLQGDQPDLLGHRGDLAGPDVLRGVVDRGGLTVEVRAGDVVPALVAVGVEQQAGDTVDVA